MSTNIGNSGKNGNVATENAPHDQNRGKNGNAGRSLVLGGGGVTGIAWEIGLLFALAEGGVDLTQADLFVGTSAGSVVGALVAGGHPLYELYAGQIAPVHQSGSSGNSASMGVRASLWWAFSLALPGSPTQRRARLGHAALRAKTGPESERIDAFAHILHGTHWPDARLLVCSVDAETGAFAVFDRESGVPLVRAVAASCSVPLVWPPISIDGSRYVDGGVRSPANVDLARGCGHVVVLAPQDQAVQHDDVPSVQAANLGPDVRVTVVSPDKAARHAIGRNVLDPRHRAPSAHAGYAQGVSIVDRIRAVWE